MPYGGDPANSDTDAVRALIRDTSTSAPLLTDSEVTWLVAEHPSVYFAASVGAGMIAANFSDAVIQKKVGDLSWMKGNTAGGVASEYRSLADQLHDTAVRQGVAAYAGGISVSDKQTQREDTDWDRPDIGLKMHDNPTASETTGARLGF